MPGEGAGGAGGVAPLPRISAKVAVSRAVDCGGAPTAGRETIYGQRGRWRASGTGRLLARTYPGAHLLDPRRPPTAAPIYGPRPACQWNAVPGADPPHRVVSPAGGVPGPRPGQKPRPACTRGTGFQAEPPQGTGGCRKANPGVHTARDFRHGPPRDAALPQLAGRRDFGAARKFVPRVRMGCSFWHGHERCASPAGVRGRGPRARRLPRAARPALRHPLPSPSRGTGRDEVQLVAAEARCERFLQATPVPRSAPPLLLRRWEGRT